MYYIVSFLISVLASVAGYYICNLVEHHDYYLEKESQGSAFRRFVGKLGMDNFMDYNLLRQADIAGQSDYNLDKKLACVEVMKNLYQMVVDENQCIKISDLAIGGKELMELGMKPGRDMGQMLHYLLDKVLDNPSLNEKDTLIELVKSKMSS